VYGWERLVLLRHLLDEGLKKTDIAARLGVSRGLIYHWLRGGGSLPTARCASFRNLVRGNERVAPVESQ